MIQESISITLPAYNEKDNLKDVVLEALSVVKKITSDYEILIVDDGSTDGTKEIADSLAKEYPNVKVLHHKKNLGFGGAIKSCYRNATKDLVFLSPADKQVNMENLNDFVKAIEGKDAVLGYRKSRPEKKLRIITSKVFHFLLKLMFGLNFKEMSASLLFRRKALDVPMKSKSAFLSAEVLYRIKKNGGKFGSTLIDYYPRTQGEEKGNKISVILKTCKDLFKLWYLLKIKE